MKDKTTAGILALLLGGIGVHKFYLGRGGQGVLYLLFFWTFIPAIVALFEGIILLVMSDAEFNAKYNVGLISAGAPQNIVVNVANTAQAGGDDLMGKLKSLNDLRVAGALTDEEFQTQKQKLLGAQ